MKKYYPVILWALFILALSIGPSPNLPQTLDFEPDKLAHAFVYAVLAFLSFKYRDKTKKLTRQITLEIITACAIYGFVLEVIQKTFFPYRYFEWGDVIANTVGSILGWIIFYYIYRRKGVF